MGNETPGHWNRNYLASDYQPPLEDEGATQANPELIKQPTELRELIHSVQQPLTVIIAIAELSQYRELDFTTKEDFSLILDEATKLQKIMLDIRNYLPGNPPK